MEEEADEQVSLLIAPKPLLLSEQLNRSHWVVTVTIAWLAGWSRLAWAGWLDGCIQPIGHNPNSAK